MKRRAERTVFVVDDDDAVRDALSMLFHAAGLKVETFASAREFLERYRPGAAGCLVLDIRMPEISGLVLQDEMNRRQLRIPVVFLSGHGDVSVAVRTLKQGAFDFVQKPYENDRLVTVVRQALAHYRAQRRQLARQPVNSEAAAERLAQLSERERDVLDRMLGGKPTRVIAQELGISAKTVEFHRARIRHKLGVTSVVELFKLFAPETETAARRP